MSDDDDWTKQDTQQKKVEVEVKDPNQSAAWVQADTQKKDNEQAEVKVEPRPEGRQQRPTGRQQRPTGRQERPTGRADRNEYKNNDNQGGFNNTEREGNNYRGRDYNNKYNNDDRKVYNGNRNYEKRDNANYTNGNNYPRRQYQGDRRNYDNNNQYNRPNREDANQNNAKGEERNAHRRNYNHNEVKEQIEKPYKKLIEQKKQKEQIKQVEQKVIEIKSNYPKFMPESSIMLHGTKISLCYSNILFHSKDFLIFPFENQKLEIYPGASFANTNQLIRAKIQSKRTIWEQKQGSVFSLPFKGQFKGIIFVKLPGLDTGLKNALKQYAGIGLAASEKKSIAMPFMGNNTDIKSTAQNMITIILKQFEKGPFSELKQLVIYVKNKQQYRYLEEQFRKQINKYIQDNEIFID